MCNLSYFTPYKWSCGTLLVTGRGPPCTSLKTNEYPLKYAAWKTIFLLDMVTILGDMLYNFAQGGIPRKLMVGLLYLLTNGPFFRYDMRYFWGVTPLKTNMTVEHPPFLIPLSC